MSESFSGSGKKSWLDRWFAGRSRRRFAAGSATAPLTPDELRRIPRHIGIIMDGNGRWAQQRGMRRSYGHRVGAENLKQVTEICGNLGVKYLTVYAFSTENWKRPAAEVEGLMKLFVEFFHRYDAELAEQDVRLRFAGNIPALPEAVRRTITEAEQGSLNRRKMQLIIAFNYGGRQELVDAIKAIVTDVQAGRLTDADINERTVAERLYLPDVPDPELIIRPGGEMRLSNFLLWQSAYAEFWSDRILWPDFDRACLERAIRDYIQRDRRFGGVKTK